jgi:similar to stage IV sporulation protein
MKAMNKLDKYKKGSITVEIQSHMPEKFINLLWKNGVNIRNIRKKNITTIVMETNLSDYKHIEEIAVKTKAKVRIVGRKGTVFFLIKMRRRVALVGGAAIFVFIIYFLSTFIWKVEIQTENHLSPYEIRAQLKAYGIAPGVRKSKVNVYELQDKMIKNNENIMYFRARIEGSRLFAEAIEKTPPPAISSEDSPGNLVAKKDGQILRVFTTHGTSVVKKGDVVKAGQIIVKGEQGKEGSTYVVHAEGSVFANTWYEEVKSVPVRGITKERTGKSIENNYVMVLGKRVYFKNSLNKFKTYDKIVQNKGLLKKEIYYETKETNFNLDVDKVVKDTSEQLYTSIVQKLDKSVKIVDKKVFFDEEGDNLKIRVLVTAEEDIAKLETLQ